MSEIIASTYELIEKIGSGGGGNVFLANHLRLGKKVVLKADKRKITTRPELLRREVDVLKNLSHSYIPQVYDFFTDEETVYTVMDYIEGESLDKPLKHGEKFSQPQVIQWAVQLLQALCYLHSPTHGTPPHGFVHSDIKPANLMCRPNGDICLIDFNIALSIGEENAVGGSAGYASPEHYGLDFSFSGSTATQDDKTALLGENTATLTLPTAPLSSSGKKTIVPDARSDIYSTGATLYHLLSGKRPARNAMEVEPLSEKEFSPQIVKIISKAMNPNPDLRYQTAAEMLDALEHLHENDPRTKRHKRRATITAAVLSALFLAGGLCTLIGLKQMEREQETARIAAEAAQAEEKAAKEAEKAAKEALAAVTNSENALRTGDLSTAVGYAMEALTLDTPYAAQAQKALTDALGVYNLSDGFQSHLLLTLPSEPLKVVLSPLGTYVAALTSGQVTVFDTETGEQLAQLAADPSALSDIVFSGEQVLIYAGEGALRSYDLLQGTELWAGNPATGISLSGDGTTVAAVYKDETVATVYDALTGEVLRVVTFQDKSQYIAVNDSFADPEDNLFVLNRDGTLLAVSFSNGALWIYDLRDSEMDAEIFDASDYTHFEGGFSGQYFAFSAANDGESVFAVIDMDSLAQTGGFASTMPFHVQADESGIYVSTENALVKLDPVTGEQTEVAYTGSDITAFSHDAQYTMTATADGAFSFFDAQAQPLEEFTDGDRSDFVQTAGSFAVAACLDTPSLRVLKLENHPEAQLSTYDADYIHNEARVSADGTTVMLFQYDGFRLYDINGDVLAEADIPDAERVYDQQYRRDKSGSYLEVIYYDGLVRRYSAVDGTLLSEKYGEKPDETLYEEFLTDRFRITSPLHGTPSAYNRETGEFVRALEKDAYLTYVTQVGEYVITEYITAQGERYGLLLDENCETLARLPNLCDILIDGTLIFDDMSGNLRQSRIYSIQELMALAET